MGKNCALGLEYGLGPYSRPQAQFFPIRTFRLVNNVYLLETGSLDNAIREFSLA